MSQDSPEKKQLPSRLVWIDMEMSGLDPKKERIIEIATIITDENLEIIEEGPDLVIHQSDEIMDNMDDWNKKHHKKSGLWEEVTKSKISIKKAEEMTLELIKKHCNFKKSPLCGNSIHHDRRFIERYMPKIHDYLHYRHVDVSTIKSLIYYWYGKTKDNIYKKNNQHRALDDIRQSIEELRFYRKQFFKSRALVS